ncbi:hypothetical protein CLAVI_000162 [Candidatus Clavichlamydia salmonicola]|uniref:tetratricopeptide repeat protein n=1 Tax=Candidatus Clavichlamydia salmonicola TaxID=469812 RepID=UPI001890EABE|nr:tetratricopeptide repeat protein [Candidatus Clavichlamydia salmonicola]MBF5050551.1 hypothetical protein [Candidatus Clavichlamydia salmonicola]
MLVLSFSFIGLFFGLVVCLGLKFRSRMLHLSKIPILRSSDDLLKDVGYFFSLEQWEKAEHALKKLSKDRRYYRQTLLFFSYLYRHTNRFAAALNIVHEGIELFPDEKRFSLEKALASLSFGNTEEALSSFERAFSLIWEEGDRLSYAKALLFSGQFHKSLSILQPLSKILPSSEVWELLGQVLFELQDWAQSFIMYEKALDSGKEKGQILEKLGHLSRKLGNVDQATHFFKMLLQKKTGSMAAGLFGLGLCAEDKGHYHKAFLIYQASLSKGAFSPFILKHAGLCALREGAFFLAEEYLSSVLNLQTQSARDPNVMLYYGLACEYQKKWQKAETIYLKLLAEYKNYTAAYKALARLFSKGLSRFLSPEEGLKMAQIIMEIEKSDAALDIFNACQQRIFSDKRDAIRNNRPPISWKGTRRRRIFGEASVDQTLAA